MAFRKTVESYICAYLDPPDLFNIYLKTNLA